MKLQVIAPLIAAGMLFGAFLPMPYVYYELLRVVIFAVSAWLAYDFGKHKQVAVAVGFGLLALLYNPVFPIHLVRTLWMFINLATIVPFIWVAYRHWRQQCT